MKMVIAVETPNPIEIVSKTKKKVNSILSPWILYAKKVRKVVMEELPQ